MKRSRSIAAAAVALAGLFPVLTQGATALPCTAVAAGDAGWQASGRSLPLPASLDDCRGARVTKGQVIACVADAKGAPVCRAFGTGEAIEARRFDSAGRAATVAGLDRVLRLQPGGRDAAFRGVMIDPTRPAEPLLPAKTVLLLDGQLLVDFSEPEMQGVDAVEIRRDSSSGPVVARAPRTAGPARIAADALADGPSYWAVPQSGAQPTPAPKRFSVAPAQERQVVLAKLQVFDRQQAGPLATAMMRAAWLAQQSYDYDALVTMKTIGMRVR
jgi:hypothetical protein